MKELESVYVLRATDEMTCTAWPEGGVYCGTKIPVPQSRGGSHRTLADYVDAFAAHRVAGHRKRPA